MGQRIRQRQGKAVTESGMDPGGRLQAHEGWLLVRVLVIGLILVVFCAIFGPYAHYILKRCRGRHVTSQPKCARDAEDTLAAAVIERSR